MMSGSAKRMAKHNLFADPGTFNLLADDWQHGLANELRAYSSRQLSTQCYALRGDKLRAHKWGTDCEGSLLLAVECDEFWYAVGRLSSNKYELSTTIYHHWPGVLGYSKQGQGTALIPQPNFGPDCLVCGAHDIRGTNLAGCLS